VTPITFRNSKIVYYGPHQCENCGVNIVKMGREWGGTAFTNPEGPIYPNTEWHPHVCDQHLVRERRALIAGNRVGEQFPQAHAKKIGELGFVILGEDIPEGVEGGSYLVVSANHTFYDTMEAAWNGALERIEKGWPSWHIDLARYGPDARFGNDLDALPQCPA
jgi:hypothetical protein